MYAINEHEAGKVPAIRGRPRRLARILAPRGRPAAAGRPGRGQVPVLAQAQVPVPSLAWVPARVRAPVRALGVAADLAGGLAPERVMAVGDSSPSPVLHLQYSHQDGSERGSLAIKS